jgi:hypothetical protein
MAPPHETFAQDSPIGPPHDPAADRDTTRCTPKTTGQLPQLHEARNAGMPLDLDWVARVQANTSAIERRAASLPGRRTVKKAYQAAWLARAITLIDLTTLAGDDTEGRVRRLCAKARQPVRAEILDALGLPTSPRARSASTTRWCPPPSRRWQAPAFPSPPSPPGFRRGCRPTTCASRRSRKA